jgi:hypothetical protein
MLFLKQTESARRSRVLSDSRLEKKSERNLYKMTIAWPLLYSKVFFRDAVNAGCDVAIVEMTSEGVKQFRHKIHPPRCAHLHQPLA